MDALAGIIANDPALAALRGVYAFNILVFGILLAALWRPMEGGETLRRSLLISYAGYRGLVRGFWLAIFLLSAVGLVLPVEMVPVLVLQALAAAGFLIGTEYSALKRGDGLQSQPGLVGLLAGITLVWPPVLIWALAG